MNILLQRVHPLFGVYINEYWTIFQDSEKKIFSFCRSTEEWTAKNRTQYRNGQKYRKCYARYNDQIRVLVEKFRQSDYKLEEILKGLACCLQTSRKRKRTSMKRMSTIDENVADPESQSEVITQKTTKLPPLILLCVLPEFLDQEKM